MHQHLGISLFSKSPIMKNLNILFILLIPFLSFGQDTLFYYPNECSTAFNAFLNNSNYSQVENLVHKIIPDGTLFLDPEQTASGLTIYDILDEMGLDQGTTFSFTEQVASKLSDSHNYNKYQQYHNGVKVEGGGFVEGIRIYDGPTTGPCDEEVMLMPNIVTGINVSTTPTYSSSNLSTMFPEQDTNKLELVLVTNIEGNCNIKLAWKGSYIISETQYFRYVDAHNGQELASWDLVHHGNITRGAPMKNTNLYDNIELTTRHENGTTTLETEDQSLQIFDFIDECPRDEQYRPSDWETNLIPSTNAPVNNDWGNEGSEESYQLFHLFDLALSDYGTLGITFNNVDVGYCSDHDNATSLPLNDPNDGSRFLFGNVNGKFSGQYDIVVHEIAHSYLNDRIGEYARIHEGVADMFAIFLDYYRNNNSTDWIFGNDLDDSGFTRDATENGCFNENLFNNSQADYINGRIMNHWLYLISEGDSNQEIPGIGLDKAFLIVLDALSLCGDNPSFVEFANKTLVSVVHPFGRCSDEYKAIYNAWKAVCMDPDWSGPCNSTITGPSWTCEEEQHISNSSPYHFCYDGGQTGTYTWTIISENSPQFDLSGNQTGNKTVTGSCMDITEIPEFNFYPKVFTIEVYNNNQGHSSKISRSIIIKDCNNDDPDCEDYYGLMPNNTSGTSDLGTSLEIKEITNIEVYDYLGRLLFKENNPTLQNHQLPKAIISIILYKSSDNQVVKIERKINY